eukprot:CAMPEP_0184479196 /NCGR_PEP_ID=MMETSP0113_2-20130426/1019_1 /TAXON_ID=91329 /ORGANISM="Norrisiella sphaerica, Strain BC52" /LENGTH=186 /DNA_ID=CAMNT_0026857227 /DNA_START=50 /DNA_END=610 /DNA_ORIENTATION=+
MLYISPRARPRVSTRSPGSVLKACLVALATVMTVMALTRYSGVHVASRGLGLGQVARVMPGIPGGSLVLRSAERQPNTKVMARKATVKVLDAEGNELQSIPTQTGEILRDVLLENNVDVYDWWGKGMNCGGQGSCLTCLVDVDNGCGQKTDYEIKKLRNKPENWRLACQSVIERDTVVRTKPQTKK